MWSNRLIKGRYLGVLLTFVAGFAAQTAFGQGNDPVNIPNTAKVSLQMKS